MPRSTRKAGLVPRFPASHEPPGGASREPCAHLRSKCASRMGGGSRSFILARLELASRHPTNRLAALRGNPALTSDRNALRAWVEAAGASFWRGSNSLPGIPRTAWRRFAGTLRSPQIKMRFAHGWRQRVRETGLHCKKITPRRCRGVIFWSGRRGSNSLPPPWQGGALPDELRPRNIDDNSRFFRVCQAVFFIFPQMPFVKSKCTKKQKYFL